MKVATLILSRDDLGIKDEDLTPTLKALKSQGAILSYRTSPKSLRLTIDPVRAELLKETFLPQELPAVPKGKQRNESY